MPSEHSLKVAREWEQGLYADIFVGGSPVDDAWNEISRSLAALLDRELQAQHERTTARYELEFHASLALAGLPDNEWVANYIRAVNRIAAAPRPTGESE